MDLIRLIKLKKINGELDDLTEQEKYILSIFNNLHKHGDIYYDIVFDYERTIFQFSHRYKNVFCSYSMCKEIMKKFHISPKNTEKLILGIFKKVGLDEYNLRYIMDVMR